MVHNHNLPRPQQLLRDDQTPDRLHRPSARIPDYVRVTLLEAKYSCRVYRIISLDAVF